MLHKITAFLRGDWVPGWLAKLFWNNNDND